MKQKTLFRGIATALATPMTSSGVIVDGAGRCHRGDVYKRQAIGIIGSVIPPLCLSAVKVLLVSDFNSSLWYAVSV